MALESATYINSLNSSNPVATDPLSQADEHIRLLKSTIKATWPNITGAVAATQADLDTKSAITSNGSTPSLTAGITGGEVKTLIGVVEPAISTDGATPALTSGITAAEVRNLVGAQEAATAIGLLNVYPIGSVYISVLVTNPNLLFGGTWERIGAGKALVGLDSADLDFNALGETGGAKAHTLTVNEIPSHTHAFTAMQDTNNSVNRSGGGDLGAPASSTTVATGGGAAHNNLQPYLVVSMWKRTA
jgi:hypothetical protein